MNEDFVITKNENLNAAKQKSWFAIVAVVCVVAILGLAVLALPKPFQMTHEQIGKGAPVIVFVYDPNLEISISQTEQMNIAREQLGEQVLFLIAKIRTPEGDQFIDEHQARIAELLLFNPSGKLIKRQSGMMSSGELILWVSGI